MDETEKYLTGSLIKQWATALSERYNLVVFNNIGSIFKTDILDNAILVISIQ